MHQRCDAVELLEHVAILTRQRADALRQQRTRTWSPASGQPFVLLIIDELADVIAYQPDNTLRKRANVALQTILSQGRAPGVCVIGQIQNPRKQVLDCRHLFSIKIAMRLDEPEQVDMVLINVHDNPLHAGVPCRGPGERPRGLGKEVATGYAAHRRPRRAVVVVVDG